MALTTFQKIGIGIVTVGALATGGYFTTKSPAPSTKKSGVTPIKPTIDITTTNLKPLTFQFGTALVDVCFVRAPLTHNEKNLLDPQWISDIKNLGFQRSVCLSDGSITQVSHIKTDGTGKGYNGSVNDFGGDQRKFDDWGNGVLQPGWTSDFWSKTYAFVNALGIPMDVVLNKKDSWKDNKWRIDNSKCDYIILDAETTNEWKPADYVIWANKTVDSIRKYYPTKKIIADQCQMWQGSKKATDWRNQVTPSALKNCYGADPYWQMNDQVNNFRGFTNNEDSNILRVGVFFDSIVPAQLAYFQTQFPGWKYIAGQCNIADNREGAEQAQHVNNNIVGMVAWGRFAEMFIENQDIQPMAIQQTLKNCDDPSQNNYQAIKLINKLFKASNNVIGVTFTSMTGCTGVAMNDASQSTKYTLLINNSSKNTYTVSKLNVDGVKNTPSTYVMQRIYGSDGTWQSPGIIKDSINISSITIPPASVNVITFSTAAPLQ